MKKLIVRLFIVVVILIVLAVVSAIVFLDPIVKKGVETAGPMITKVEVKLESVGIAFSGSAHLKGLVVGNPAGSKTPNAISVGDVKVSLVPMSLLSKKIVIKSVNVQSPDITIEGGLTQNNLTKILDNVNATAGGGGTSATNTAAGGGKKIEVDDLLVTDAKVSYNGTLSLGKTVTFPIPTIHLTDLGQGTDGITPAELIKRVLTAVTDSTLSALKNGITSLGKGAENAAKAVGTDAKKGVESVTDSVKGLFKK